MSPYNVTRGDLPLRDEDRKRVDRFKEEVKQARLHRYGQNKDKDKKSED